MKRQCSQCGQTKDLAGSFYRHPTARLGYNTVCVACHKLDSRRRQLAARAERDKAAAAIPAAQRTAAAALGIPPEQLLRTQIGRIALAGHLKRLQYDSLNRWLRVRHHYRVAMGQRPIRSPGFELGSLAHEPDPDSILGALISDKEIASRKAYNKVLVYLGRDLAPPLEHDEGRLQELGANSVAHRVLLRLSDETITDADIANLVAAADTLARFYHPHEALMTKDKWLNASEVCERLGVCRPTLYAMMKDGRWPPGRIVGRRLRRWTEDDFEAASARLPGKLAEAA